MILNDKEIEARLNSPMNLINRLNNGSARNSAMSLFGLGRSSNGSVARVESKSETVKSETDKTETPSAANATSEIIPATQPAKLFNPFAKTAEEVVDKETATIDKLIDNSDSQIKLSQAHDQALDVLTASVKMLRTKLDDIHPSKLPQVISATSKVVESIRRERSDAVKNGREQTIHYHFYTPVQKVLADYGEVIEASVVAQ